MHSVLSPETSLLSCRSGRRGSLNRIAIQDVASRSRGLWFWTVRQCNSFQSAPQTTARVFLEEIIIARHRKATPLEDVGRLLSGSGGNSGFPFSIASSGRAV